jgi:hypothetical protein
MNRRGVPAAAPGMGADRRSPAKACALLLPVWGVDFLRQFLDFCLPTLLAAGNVPALAEALPTRFVLLTRSCDVPLVLEHPAWQQLARLCEIEIQPIDDLIVEANHHAAVTLAYVRALRATGAALRDTVFLFLVGDCLLADGSLRPVLERIRAGASGVLVGSLQVSAKAALALLRERPAESTRELALPPRVLADWALANLHPRSAANIVNTSRFHDPDANRLFWSVDKHTLIGRFYLLHMIAIRPEVSNFVVGAPCDYAFIPELCPSGKVDVLTDSDNYLAVELQRRTSQRFRSAPARPTQLARNLSQWTTAQHRQNADVTLVFHARDVPENIAEARALAARFVDEIGKSLQPEPQPHRGHPSWIGMMAVQRAGGGLPDDCKQVVDFAGSRARVTSLLWRLRLHVLGHPPNVTAWHPRWPDFHLIYAGLKNQLKQGDRLLVLSASAPAFARWLKPLCRDITASEWQLLSRLPDPSGATAPSFDACLWIAECEQLDLAAAVLDRVAQALKAGGRLSICVVEDLDVGPFDPKRVYACLGLDKRQSELCIDEVQCVSAGRLRLALYRALAGTMRAQRGRRRAFVPVLLAACALIAGAIGVGNRTVWTRRLGLPARGKCSSILLAAHQVEDAKSVIGWQNARMKNPSKSIRSHEASGPPTDPASVGLR